MGTRDNRTISEESVVQLQAGQPQRRRGNRALAQPSRPRGSGRLATEPNLRECPWGSGGKRCSGTNSRVAQGAVGDLAGSPGVHYVAAKGLRTRSGNSPEVPAAVPLWQPWVFHHGCSTACAPRHRRQLTQLRLHELAGRGRETAAPARVPGQRAHAARPRPACPLAPGDWRLNDEGSRARDVIGCNSHSLNEPGRGGASSGRDTTARLFQGR